MNGSSVITDFIGNIQVKQSGYNAEYRAATGGVISAVTKSGSNVFHGDAGTYYTSNDFLGKVSWYSRSALTNCEKLGRGCARTLASLAKTNSVCMTCVMKQFRAWLKQEVKRPVASP